MKHTVFHHHRNIEKDEDEVIEVRDIPVKDLNGMIRDGTIVDAKTICLIHRCLGC